MYQGLRSPVINHVRGIVMFPSNPPTATSCGLQAPLAQAASTRGVVVAPILEHSRRAVLALPGHHLANVQLLADQLDVEVADGAMIGEAPVGAPVSACSCLNCSRANGER